MKADNRSSSVILLFLFLCCSESEADEKVNWFDEQSLFCTVLLEKVDGDSIVPHGTGFLAYNYEIEGRPIVVTCAHVLKGREIYVSVTADSAFIVYIEKKTKGKGSYTLTLDGCDWELIKGKLRCRVKLEKDLTFVTHPSLDIAAFPISLGTKAEIRGSKMRITKTTTIPLSGIKSRSDINLGKDVYFVGFPFTIGTKDVILRPLVRSGCVAWLSPSSNIFLLDAFSYSGNSGGPVFLKKCREDEQPILIGMIIGHRGLQTAKGIDIENWGLARCVWIDDIITVIEEAKRLK